MTVDVFRILSILLLAVLLFIPTSKIIWALSSRRLARKLGRELTAPEILNQRHRARIIAMFLVVVFSYLFHLNVLDKLHG